MKKNVIGLLLLVALHMLALGAMAEWRVAEAVLAPNETARYAVMGAVLFLMIRLCLFVIGPGAVLTLLYWRCLPVEKGNE